MNRNGEGASELRSVSEDRRRIHSPAELDA